MKILVGEFVSETNENIPQLCRIDNYVIAFDDQCIQNLDVSEVYEAENWRVGRRGAADEDIG